MQNQLAEISGLIKKFLGNPSSSLLKLNRKPTVNLEKKIHVELVDHLTRIIRIIDTQPAVMASCEKARFIVANAPLGTVPAGKQLLETALLQLELVKEHEPQIRYPLTKLKPLVAAYLTQ